MQSFKLESLVMVGDYSQLVKGTNITSNYSLKDYIKLSPSTDVSSLNIYFPFEKHQEECWGAIHT